MDKRLHWTQRVALVRHNLHASRRTGDFSFFKTVQAYTFLEGVDHVATLSSTLGNDADTVLSTLDNLNAGIAHVHQDAFKNVYDGIKQAIMEDGITPTAGSTSMIRPARRASLRVDASQQKQMADYTIDRMANSAVALINAQPPACQEAVANAWITGTTIVADAIKVCLDQTDAIAATATDDFIQLEYAWSTVQTAVDSAVAALRGIFSLMAIDEPALTAADTGKHSRSSSASTSSALDMLRRFSNAFSHSTTLMGPPPSPMHYKVSRGNGVPTPNAIRASVGAAFPTQIPHIPIGISHTQLTPIPPTPMVVEGMVDPFEMAQKGEPDDYFKVKEKRIGKYEFVPIESVDPLTSPAATHCKGLYEDHEPNFSRRMSSAFEPPPVVA